ncbi:hypothetical protein BN136_150 [Cronobacter universalis NCTC 9529]|nr:hypothetical protein BN136_150 [Cronobacter universalis NCTC 9529]
MLFAAVADHGMDGRTLHLLHAAVQDHGSLRLAVFFNHLQTIVDGGAGRHALLADNLYAAVVQRGFLCKAARDNLIAQRADSMIRRRPADQNLLGAVLHQLILHRRGDIGRKRERPAAGKRTPYRRRQQHRPAGAFALRSGELGDHDKRTLDFTPHQPVTAIKTSLHVDALETRSDAVMRRADLGLPMLLF